TVKLPFLIANKQDYFCWGLHKNHHLMRSCLMELLRDQFWLDFPIQPNNRCVSADTPHTPSSIILRETKEESFYRFDILSSGIVQRDTSRGLRHLHSYHPG